MLVSFQLASKHPENLIALFNNLEQTAADPTCFEVLVKADIEDKATQDVLESEAKKRKFKLVAMITPRRRGYEDLWQALNELFHLTDPSAYFVCNINDEVRITQHGWDERLSRYKGLFPDNIFRLRTSKLKFRNYYDFWECGFAPENYAFFTKRWLDICGDWNPCFGPDSSQQYIAYYLGYSTKHAIKQYNRDVPILDISWRNEGVGRNLTIDEVRRRTAVNFRLWGRQVSHPMQEEMFRRARLLQAHIMQTEMASHCAIEIVDEPRNRTIVLKDGADGELLDLLPYKINRVRHALRNLRRNAHYTYFAGGGREASNLLPFSVAEFLMFRHPAIRRFVEAASPVRLYAGVGTRAAALRGLIRRNPYTQRLRTRTGQSRRRIWQSLVAPIALPFILLASIPGRFRLLVPGSVKGRLRRAKSRIPRRFSFGYLRAETSRPIKSILRKVWNVARVGLLPLIRVARSVLQFTRSIGNAAFSVVRRILWSARASGRFVGRRLMPGYWRFVGKRVSLAVEDHDYRWLIMRERAHQRIANTRDPWFEATPHSREQELETDQNPVDLTPESVEPLKTESTLP